MSKTVLVGFLIGVALALLCVDIAGIFLLRQRNALARTVAVDDLGAIHPSHRFDAAALAEIKAVIPATSPEEIMANVMNLVDATGTFSSADPLEVYHYVEIGGGIGCGGLSSLFSGALAAHGIPFRQVSLQRNYYDLNNTHTAVEVLVEGRWILLDPSLNISYIMGGERIGAQTVSNALHDGKVEDLIPHSYGQVTYPVGIDGMGEAWFSLLTTFDNVYVMENNDPSWIEKIPPFRYWIGPRLYFESQPDIDSQPNQHDFHETVYFTLIVVLPVMIVLALIAAGSFGVCLFREKKRDG